MNTAESLALARFIRAACPQQKFDEYTVDAWHELIGDLAFGDCKTAAKTLAQRQPFVSPSEIRTEVRRIRAERVRAVEASLLEPHDVDPSDPRAYIAAKRRRIAAIAAGEPVTVAPTPMVTRDVPKLIAETVKSMPVMPPALPVAEKDKRRPQPRQAAS